MENNKDISSRDGEKVEADSFIEKNTRRPRSDSSSYSSLLEREAIEMTCYLRARTNVSTISLYNTPSKAYQRIPVVYKSS